MLSAKLQDALNRQINAEFYSSYLYLSMAAYFEDEDLKGMAHWMRIQSAEETGHALRIFDFINNRSGRVTLAAIDAPKTEWKSVVDAFDDAYKHEQKITGMINDLFNLAAAERDAATHDFLEWFAREQVEEESAAQLIVAQAKRVGDAGLGVYLLDQELGKRGAA
jgi:ferritin